MSCNYTTDNCSSKIWLGKARCTLCLFKLLYNWCMSDCTIQYECNESKQTVEHIYIYIYINVGFTTIWVESYLINCFIFFIFIFTSHILLFFLFLLLIQHLPFSFLFYSKTLNFESDFEFYFYKVVSDVLSSLCLNFKI